MGYYDEPEDNSGEPSVFHVTLPIAQDVVITVRAPFDTDVDDLARLAYVEYKQGADAVAHGPPQVVWDDVSVEIVEDNAPVVPEWDDSDAPEAA